MSRWITWGIWKKSELYWFILGELAFGPARFSSGRNGSPCAWWRTEVHPLLEFADDDARAFIGVYAGDVDSLTFGDLESFFLLDGIKSRE